jgi:hypothetical protein
MDIRKKSNLNTIMYNRGLIHGNINNPQRVNLTQDQIDKLLYAYDYALTCFK